MLAGDAFHRGAAFGDFFQDGCIGVVVSRLNQAPLVLRNRCSGNWIGLRLEGTRSNRDGIGARVHLVTAGGEQWNRVTTAVGYASSSDPTVHFGLGPAGRAERIEIKWPSGKRQVLSGIAGNRIVSVREPRD